IRTTLERAGYQVQLLDCLDTNQKRTIPLPAKFRYLQPFYPADDLSPFKLFTHFRHFGISDQMIATRLRPFQPDLIGISVNFTPYAESALQVAGICRSLFPNVPIVAGGHHATAAPEHLLESPAIDFIILGEGELRLLHLIEALDTKNQRRLFAMDGLAFRSDNGIVVKPIRSFIEPLDQLPRINPATTGGMMITSRGCPGHCHFCSIAGVMGQKFRPRSIDAIVEEMEWGVRQGQREFDFEDDHLTCDRRRAKELLREIIRSFGEGTLKLSAMNGLRPDTLDEELVQLMKKAGFEWLNLPLVSSSHAMQARLHRHQSRERFAEVVHWAQQHGLKAIGYLILGLPEDTISQMMEDIIFLTSLPVLIGPSLFYPAPGSFSFQHCVAKGYITGADYSLYRSSAVPVETEHFSRQDLITLFRLVRAINFLKQWIDRHCHAEQSLTDLLSEIAMPSASFCYQRKLTRDEIGSLLLKRLFESRKLQGLILKKSGKDFFEYGWLDYSISDEIVKQVLDRMTGQAIAGIATPRRCIL
ncbi:MAG: B12-binding domain-containing radical SAM protein, partial [candidate division KSB1 bacterium]|nr:B12-binding domain-containing radical SAM protein [candidate division KSB1 bacterium]